MFNLIPENLKEHVMRDYKERRLVLWFAGVLILTGVICVFIVPTWVFMFFEEKNMITQTEFIHTSNQFKKVDEVAQVIKETNGQLGVLARLKQERNPVDAIERVINAKNTSIHISDLIYVDATKTASSTIQLQGVADKREGLKQFMTDLEKLKEFSKVELPVSNFAKDKNIDFNITLIFQ